MAPPPSARGLVATGTPPLAGMPAKASTPPNASPPLEAASQETDEARRIENARRPTTPMGAPIMPMPSQDSGPRSISGSLARGEVSQPNRVLPQRSRTGTVVAILAGLLVVGGGGFAAKHFGLFEQHAASNSTPSTPSTAPPPEAKIPAPAETVPAETPPSAPKSEPFLIRLSVEPSDAHVLVNGVARTGKPPFLLEGPAGTVFTVEANKDGYQPWTKAITLADHDDKVTAKLEATAAPPPSAPAHSAAKNGTLFVLVIPFAEVSVDGKRIGSTPIRSYSIKPGSHVVEMVHRGLNKKETREVDIKPGHSEHIQIDWSN
jgi:serine/threonine-protein kinase